MPCAKKLLAITGTAHGKDLGNVIIRAINHLMTNGAGKCVGPCGGAGGAAGICRFGLTKLNEEIQVAKDVSGKGVTVTVTGDGECFCS